MTPEKNQGYTATAKEAAEVLGLSLSQFNERRRHDTWIYNVQDQTLGERVDPGLSRYRQKVKSLHLVTPTLAGRKPAGGRWEYNLEKLRRLRDQPWPGSER